MLGLRLYRRREQAANQMQHWEQVSHIPLAFLLYHDGVYPQTVSPIEPFFFEIFFFCLVSHFVTGMRKVTNALYYSKTIVTLKLSQQPSFAYQRHHIHTNGLSLAWGLTNRVGWPPRDTPVSILKTRFHACTANLLPTKLYPQPTGPFLIP